MFYFDILTGLYKYDIKYLIVGGLAVNIHGVPRITMDIDIIISLDIENVKKLCVMMKELGYVPRLPVDPMDMSVPEKLNSWINEKNMKAFSFYNSKFTTRVLDIVIVHSIDFDEAYLKKKQFEIEGIKLDVIAIEDLVIMKKESGRSKDLSDIDFLKEIVNNDKK